jgi:hypothetical protein
MKNLSINSYMFLSIFLFTTNWVNNTPTLKKNIQNQNKKKICLRLTYLECVKQDDEMGSDYISVKLNFSEIAKFTMSKGDITYPDLLLDYQFKDNLKEFPFVRFYELDFWGYTPNDLLGIIRVDPTNTALGSYSIEFKGEDNTFHYKIRYSLSEE